MSNKSLISGGEFVNVYVNNGAVHFLQLDLLPDDLHRRGEDLTAHRRRPGPRPRPFVCTCHGGPKEYDDDENTQLRKSRLNWRSQCRGV